MTVNSVKFDISAKKIFHDRQAESLTFVLTVTLTFDLMAKTTADYYVYIILSRFDVCIPKGSYLYAG